MDAQVRSLSHEMDWNQHPAKLEEQTANVEEINLRAKRYTARIYESTYSLEINPRLRKATINKLEDETA